jgi:hypothetical protein
MRKVSSITVVSLLPVMALCLVSGCTHEDDPSGLPIPNTLPETHVTAQTPQSIAGGFTVEFAWSGSDSDGDIVGYEWMLSDRGQIQLEDPEDADPNPVTADDAAPWTFTTSPGITLTLDPEADLGKARDERDIESLWITRTYTFHVRAIDEDGGIDPTPARVHFTPTTLLPYLFVDRPPHLRDYMEAQAVPPTITFGFTAIDPDAPLGTPTQFRFLWKPAWHYDHYICTRYEFNQYVDEILSFSDPEWSDWMPYPESPLDRTVTFVDQPAFDSEDRRICYLFAVQVQDATGAVTVDRDYSRTVQNVYISDTFTPLLTVRETYLGTAEFTGIHGMISFDIAQEQPLHFEWHGTGANYGGTVIAYRWGFDVMDPDDPMDPNWAVAPGNTPQHRETPVTTFNSGTHRLTIHCWDDSEQLTRATYVLDVVPVPDPASQRPLLLVDDVFDQTSMGWPSSGGDPLDRDEYRDEFWSLTLLGPGGVMGFSPSSDIIDTESEALAYRDLVDYRTVIWTTRYAQGNFIWNNFKPTATGEEKYIWLGSYQRRVGNLLLTGSRALNEFVEEKQWMIPWVFDTDDETIMFGGSTYWIGWGTWELPDGTVVNGGTQRYPYWGMGISVLDHLTPRYNIYSYTGMGSIGNSARSGNCAGVKGLVLDTDFAANHLGGGGVFPDTIFTETAIDWRDLDPTYRDNLSTYGWNSEEFYDGNISPRTTPWAPQDCDGQPCVEPMFRICSRFDWVDDLHLQAGDPDWPAPYFTTPEELAGVCGQHALDPYDPASAQTLTSGQVLGFISHKLEQDKPHPVGDVMWGFDPYRFDHGEIRDVIHWVLGEHFGLVMYP